MQDLQPPPLPPGVDFNMQEAMSPDQLQHLLRQDFTGELLRSANVVAHKPLTPWMVLISGAFNAYGQVQYWESELDIRKIETAQDFLALVGSLNSSFDKAAEQLGKGK